MRMMRLLGTALLGVTAAFAEESRGAMVDTEFAGGTHDGTRVAQGRLQIGPGRSKGEYVSAETSHAPFSAAVVSWNATVPDGSAIEVALSVRVEGAWLPWADMGRWEGGRGGESFPPMGNEAQKVDVDTWKLKGARAADAYRYRVRLQRAASVSLIAVAAWSQEKAPALSRRRSAAWGKTIAVPERSQTTEDPSISGRICSPTSLSMVLAWHGVVRSTAEVAAGVRDAREGIYGNWPLNTAYAFLAGMGQAWVARCDRIEDLEAEIAAGHPVIISHRWRKGELTGAPVESTDGHLIVVVGFTPDGDVVVNDPAAHTRNGEKVRRSYPRQEIHHTWIENASGIAYMVRPRK